MSSNILSVFNPPPTRELSEEETQDCVPCQVMSTVFSLGFGSYLASGKPFEYSEKERTKGISVEKFQKLNPKWWRTSLRGMGGLLVVFGIVRGTEKWLWNKSDRNDQ
ncbi:LANO_0E01530g1_1 [Lachancea nothofagi CBS 11611]|uniref:LANO_0E01530g1_1 n=1 Tax=Lachancea nothofagi CBS 11611 TaxID=1266666 RepID=A0A1G4JPF8_9SACH|nr:LANO_0E01530g1_1 [Lachancea nothofagi CBS 11611]